MAKLRVGVGAGVAGTGVGTGVSGVGGVTDGVGDELVLRKVWLSQSGVVTWVSLCLWLLV